MWLWPPVLNSHRGDTARVAVSLDTHAQHIAQLWHLTPIKQDYGAVTIVLVSLSGKVRSQGIFLMQRKKRKARIGGTIVAAQPIMFQSMGSIWPMER